MGFGGYYYKQYNDLKATSSKTVDQLNEEIVQKVNKVFELPKEETPLILTVKSSNPEDFVTELEKQIAQTFKNLQKADSILIYQKAGKAILYRESENRVIDTATIVVKSGAAVHVIAPADKQNSSEQAITKSLSDQVRIVGKSTPVAQYSATTVVDLTGQKAELAKSIAAAVGGTVAATVPTGETTSEGTEIVVIVASTVSQSEPTAQPAP